jgi:hypothetical protein
VDAVSGFFHLQMNVMMLMYRMHLGVETDTFSLERWISDFGKKRNSLWNGAKEIVKDYCACNDLFELVLDSYILAAFTQACEFADTNDFLVNLNKIPTKLSDAISKLAEHLAKFQLISQMQKVPLADRDLPLENMTLFMQHGLAMRNFKRAMREGDSGRCLASLSYFTVWFQASKQYQYAAETMHLTVCLKKYWSDDYRKFYMQNCLINPSGKIEGWMADDFFCEWLIGELKDRFLDNANEQNMKYMSRTIAPQITFFRQVSEKLTGETEAVQTGDHSLSVKWTIDVERIANCVLQESMGVYKAGRNPEESEKTDLYGQGCAN